MLPNGNEEIDLFGLISVLWAAKIKIVGVILFFACIGFLVSFVLRFSGGRARAQAGAGFQHELEKTARRVRFLGTQ